MSIRLALLVLCAAAISAADTLTFADNGIVCTAPGTGRLVLSWPELSLPANKTAKAATTKVDGDKAVLTYPDGTSITVALHGGTLGLTLSQAPAEAKGVRISTTLPLTLAGSTWAFGDKTGTFPAEKPEKPFLFQGNKDVFSISKGDARQLTITAPQWSYQQLQDNREWKTNTFFWMAIAPINKDNLSMSFVIDPGK